MRAIAAWSCCLLVAAAPTAPDLVLPGSKSVKHELVLQWGPELGDQRFLVGAGPGHPAFEVERSVPFRFSRHRMLGTRLYAAPADATLPAAREALAEVDWPRCEIPVREVRSAAAGHPLARVLTTLRVVRIDGAAIELEQVASQRFDANGDELGDLEWLPLAAIAAAGAAWLWHLDRRRRQPNAAAAPGPAEGRRG